MRTLAYSRRHVILLVVLVALVTAPARASAEWFIDLYGGYSRTERADIHIRGFDVLGVPIDVELLSVDPASSPLVGARAGYWFGFAPELGLALDDWHWTLSTSARTCELSACEPL